MAALEAGDFSETYANLLTAAEEGNATAQFEIGSKLNQFQLSALHAESSTSIQNRSKLLFATT